MNNNILLFDIDKTLFDTSLFMRHHLPQHLSLDLHQKKQYILDLFEQFATTLEKPTDFDPEKLIVFLSEQINIPLQKIEQSFFSPQIYQQSLFPETQPILTSLKKTHNLGVFSEAVLKWQQQKIRLSGLLKFFEQDFVFILPNKTQRHIIFQLPKNAIIIDDKLSVIKALQQRPDLTSIWINRKKKTNTHFLTISSLEQLPHLLNQKSYGTMNKNNKEKMV